MEYIKTFWEMLARPEHVIDPFVLEKNTKYQHPFSFGLIGVIIVVALYSLVLGYRTPMLADLMSEDIDQFAQLTYWIEFANLKVSTFLLPLSIFLLLTPSLSIAGVFFFRDKIDGFYYNLIINSYAVGVSIPALLIMVPVWFINPSALFDPAITTYFPLGMVGIVLLWIYLKYLHMEGVRSWIQFLSVYALGSVIFLMLESFSASMIGYFIFAVNRFLEIWMKV